MAFGRSGMARGCHAAHLVGHVADVVGRRAAAAAQDVDDARPWPTRAGVAGLVRLLVVLAHGVGQAGVGIGGDQGVGDAGHLGDVRAHQVGAQGAVEAHGERLAVLDRVPERLGRLARQGAARAVGDGAADPDRQLLVALVAQVHDRLDRGLAVQGVGDGLDQEQVDPALVERATCSR
jgi:hypothetical protein